MKRKNGNRFSELFTPERADFIKSLELRAHRIVEGFISGLHKSPRHGFSVEFNQHKSYSPGDDIRNIDWRVYGRSDRYYIKQFEEETNVQVHLVLDHSKSMDYKFLEKVTKLEYGMLVASCLTVLMLGQRDAVGFYLASDKIDKEIPPSSKQGQFTHVLHALTQDIAQGQSDLASVVGLLAGKLQRKSLVIILSDFMEEIPRLIQSLEGLRFRQHELMLIKIHDPAEIQLPFSNMVKFVDSETGKEMTVDMVEIGERYRMNFQNSESLLLDFCNRTRSQFSSAQTSDSVEKFLREVLIRRKKLGGIK